MKIIDRPIGTRTILTEFPVLSIKDKEQFMNIIKTHVGCYLQLCRRTVEPDTFQPKIMAIILKPDNYDSKFGHTMIQYSLELAQEVKADCKDEKYKYDIIRAHDELALYKIVRKELTE